MSHDYNRVIAVAHENKVLSDKVSQVSQLFFDTMLMIAASQPDRQFRITSFDWKATVGHKLTVHVDPSTGDTVYSAVPYEEAQA